MRNLAAPNQGFGGRRGSAVGSGAHCPLAGPNQGRYKALIPQPGILKFSAWKRENEIPKTPFYEYLLNKIKDKDPKKIWLKDVTNGRTENFGRVQQSVSKIASGLTKIGFGRKDVMCMFCSNYVEYWLLALAAWSCGGCVMPVNCELDVEELEDQLDIAKAKILVCDDFNFEDALDVLEGAGLKDLKHVIVIGQEGKAQGAIPVGDLLEDDGKSPPEKPNLDWDKDTIYLPFTSSSGSKGSRGIMHTNKSIMAWFYSPENAYNHLLDQMSGDSLALGNWFFHMSGFYPVALAAIYGVTVYHLSEYTDEAFLEMIVDNKTQTAALYPWQIRLLSQSPMMSKYDLSCLKAVLTGGGVLSSTIKTELLERFPTVRYVREAYGLNEVGFVTLTYPREKKNSVSANMVFDIPDDHVMPVGMPNMYSQIKIINRQSNEPVGEASEQGEICVKSPQCFKGYLGEENKHLLDNDGFFHTGDLGFYDSQGQVHFIEKIEYLIHFWMYEVAPSILESRLLGSNNIVDAAVVGIPDKENGQVPRAFVVLRPGFEETEENLTNLMESRLQDHERIRGGLYFIESIPRDENWKVLKDVLQEYCPLSTEEQNRQLEAEEAAAIAAAAASEADGGAAQAGAAKPSKSSYKMVKELEKLPNGAFIAKPLEEASSSPRTKRINRRCTDLASAGGGAGGAGGAVSTRTRSGPRRGSMDCIIEGVASSASQASASSKWSTLPSASGAGGGGLGSGTASRRRSGGSRCGSRRGSIDSPSIPFPMAPSGVASGAGEQMPGSFNYWMKVNVNPMALESVIRSHPAVDDCTVMGYHVDGIGFLPRAYVVLKDGYEATGEEVLSFAHARLADTDKLRGGVVFVDKLAKDPSGRLIANLDKWDKEAQGVDEAFIRDQPKVNNS